MLNRLSSFNMEIKEEDPLTRWNQKYLIPKSLVALQSNMIVSFTEVVKSLGILTRRGASAKKTNIVLTKEVMRIMSVSLGTLVGPKSPTPPEFVLVFEALARNIATSWMVVNTAWTSCTLSPPPPPRLIACLCPSTQTALSEVFRQAFSGTFFVFHKLWG